MAETLKPPSTSKTGDSGIYSNYDSGNYEDSISDMLPAAREGDTTAQVLLGWAYLITGGNDNDQKAIKWLSVAAAKFEDIQLVPVKPCCLYSCPFGGVEG
jgi:hypothetical protein